MKCKMFKVIASFLLFATIIFSACNNGTTSGNQKTPNHPSRPSQPQQPEIPAVKHLNIKFDDSKMYCQTIDINPYVSGTEVKAGETYVFIAKLEGNKKLGNWFVSDKLNDTAKGLARFSYTVDEKDADENKVISIKCTIEGDTKFQFDEKKIECKKHGEEQIIKSGEKLDNKAVYEFKAKLEEGKTVATWYANDQVVNNYNSDSSKVSYKPNILHANSDNIIVIKFTLQGETKLTFDEKQIECKKEGQASAIKSGVNVNANEKYVFTAKLEAGRTVSKWFINKIPHQPTEPNKLTYSVNLKNADVKNIINVTFAEKLPIKIEYDASKIKCKKFLKDDEVSSGTVVKANEQYTFIAKLTEGKIVDHWFVNEKIASFYDGEEKFHYTVKQDDADIQNPIVISFTEKTQELLTLKFDDKKIICTKSGSSENLKSGVTVKEKELYKFIAKLDDDKIVDKWTANNKVISSSDPDRCLYTIDPKDADNNNVIEVKFTDKIAKKVKLIFDENSIKCTKSGESKNIHSGTEVKEGYLYRFNAQDVTKEDIDNWYINDKVQTSYKGNIRLLYTINPKDADSKDEIHVRFSKK